MKDRRRNAPRRQLMSVTRLIDLWDRTYTSFWFLPAGMAAAAVALSFALVQLDDWLGADAVHYLGLLYTFGPEGARAILSVVASSMITVASLVFSITMLTLQLASSQFGPRLLRNFMHDRVNQTVLGTFIATFLYCLLVLRTVRGTDDASFVPHLSVAFGVVLAVASVAVLIYFIHHIATAIRIETLLAELARETRHAIDRLYPERGGNEPPDGDIDAKSSIPDSLEQGGQVVASGGSGYVQRVDLNALIRVATAKDLIVRVNARPGRFVSERDSIALAYPRERVSDETVAALQGAFVLGNERTPEQDLEFSIRRIVEIAQRALSPGTNDPTTALYCIDRLGEALARMADRKPPSAMRFDEQQQLRILAEVETVSDLACPAFAAIARYAMADADVVARLLSTMDAIAKLSPAACGDEIVKLQAAIRSESLTNNAPTF